MNRIASIATAAVIVAGTLLVGSPAVAARPAPPCVPTSPCGGNKPPCDFVKDCNKPAVSFVRLPSHVRHAPIVAR